MKMLKRLWLNLHKSWRHPERRNAVAYPPPLIDPE